MSCSMGGNRRKEGEGVKEKRPVPSSEERRGLWKEGGEGELKKRQKSSSGRRKGSRQRKEGRGRLGEISLSLYLSPSAQAAKKKRGLDQTMVGVVKEGQGGGKQQTESILAA